MVDTTMVSLAGEAAISGVSLRGYGSKSAEQYLCCAGNGGAVIVSTVYRKEEERAACEAANQLLLDRHGHLDCDHGGDAAFKAPLLRLIYGEIDADVMRNAQIYLVYIALGFPFLAIFNCCAALFRSMEMQRFPCRRHWG